METIDPKCNFPLMGLFLKKKHIQFSRKRKVSTELEGERVKGRRWSVEEDQFLSETVLNTISRGGTQLTAFADVGEKLGRTAGACGFRWNAVLRGKNPSSYSEAKKKRVFSQLEKKRRAKVNTFADAINCLQWTEREWNKQQKRLTQLTQEIANTNQKIVHLQIENLEFQKEHHSVEWVQQEIKTRYEQLLQMISKLNHETGMRDSAMLSMNRTDRKTESETST